MSLHQRNQQILATEVSSMINNLNSEIMKDFIRFVQKPFNLKKIIPPYKVKELSYSNL